MAVLCWVLLVLSWGHVEFGFASSNGKNVDVHLYIKGITYSQFAQLESDMKQKIKEQFEDFASGFGMVIDESNQVQFFDGGGCRINVEVFGEVFTDRICEDARQTTVADLLTDELQLVPGYQSVTLTCGTLEGFGTEFEVSLRNDGSDYCGGGTTDPTVTPVQLTSTVLQPTDPPTAAPADSSSDEDNTGVILAVVFSLVGVFICIGSSVGVAWYLRRRRNSATKITPAAAAAQPQPQADSKPSAFAGAPAPAQPKPQVDPDPAPAQPQAQPPPDPQPQAQAKPQAQPPPQPQPQAQPQPQLQPQADSKLVKASTFEKTRYCELYEQSKSNPNFLDGIKAMTNFIDGVGHGKNPKEVETYKDKLSEGIYKLGTHDVEKIGAFLWTTTIKFDSRELCSYINEAIRKDDEPMVGLVVPVCRVINSMVVSTRGREGAPNLAAMPLQTYRGTTMPAEAAKWFEVGKKYRAPMYLATTVKKDIAMNFIANSLGDGRIAVLFTINFDPVLRCAHLNFLDEISACKGEAEYLMPPYSGFEVEYQKIDPNSCSYVTIKAFYDNTLPDLRNAEIAQWH